MYNNTNYPLELKTQLESLDYNAQQRALLHYHQFIVKEFFTKQAARGLLICHGMGQGKTRLAVSISEHYRDLEPQRRIIVLLPKSLESNFKNTIQAAGTQDMSQYNFISLNASNMYKQVSAEYDDHVGAFTKKVSSLDNSLLIVDEAHNLFNSITNGSKNAVGLYDLIMSSVNLKLIFLTGTPIINDPFELVPCYNMLCGVMHVHGAGQRKTNIMNDPIIDPPGKHDVPDLPAMDNETMQDIKQNDEQLTTLASDVHKHQKSGKQRQKSKTRVKPEDGELLFSESYEEFVNFFVDTAHNTIKNKNKFINRIFGLSSYYGDLYFDSNKKDFPKKLPTVIEKIPMSSVQFARYVLYRQQELDESKNLFGTASRFSSSAGGSSTYRVKTRQISNYCIPEYALGPQIGKKTREKHIDKITDVDLRNTDDFSPKMGCILTNINKHSKTTGIVYSQFVAGEGIGIFARVLEAFGWTKYTIVGGAVHDPEDEYRNYEIRGGKHKKIFAILSGSIDIEERMNIIQIFNSVENKHGDIIAILLLSGALAEGIDLKRGRHVHIMEPFWNNARISQVETRVIRYKSHTDLPPDQQNVQIYIYLSDYPIKYPNNKIFERTTDMELYENSITHMQSIDSFMLAVAESSIDCSIHRKTLSAHLKQKINCLLCSPTNELLYHPFINKDMEIPSACTQYTEKKVKVKEIIFNDAHYYYTSGDNIEIYMYNDSISGYMPLPRSHIHYGDIYSAVLEKS
jgi:Helicase conserved C-terminal domain/Type III restriction enzyme, res subunit